MLTRITYTHTRAQIHSYISRPYELENISWIAQQLENLCVYGIQCFPTPTDLLFAAHKHRYMNWLLRSNIPIIPTTFIDPRDPNMISAIKSLCSKTKTILNHVYLKRGLSECANCVWKVKTNPKEIGTIINNNTHPNKKTFWFIQPPIKELEDGAELKLYFTTGATFAFGFAQSHTGEKSVYDFEELRIDSENWQRYQVDAAISFASMVYQVIVTKAPSLGVAMRIDLAVTETGFLVNEIEHFGNMWLLTQQSNIGCEQLGKVVNSVYRYLIKRM